jgi:kynurenine formamidase
MRAEVDAGGALARLSTTDVLRAAALVRKGRVFDLAHVLDASVPAFPGRSFLQLLTGNPRRALGRNEVNWIVEYVTAPSQMGTHMDGLNHLHRAGRMHGGYRVEDVTMEWGTTCNGIETLPQVVTRGVLLDVAATLGVDRLAGGHVITPGDVEATLRRSGVEVHPGDAVLFHTGWGSQWDSDGEAYAASEPGPGEAVARWLVAHGVVMTGCDTWSYGPVPPEDPELPFVVPQGLNIDHGVVVLENLRLEELAAAGADEFLFVVSHAKLRGATGAWVAPLAII